MREESVITQAMRDAVGTETEPVTYDVEKGAIIRFAEAIGDPNPLFNDEVAARRTRYGGLIAPPTFLRSLSPGGLPKTTVESPYGAILDGGSEWEYFEPVRPGDRITITTKVSDIYERTGRLGNMLFIITDTNYTNQFGKVAATQRSVGISYEPPEKKD